jgi:hypothetical protein
VEGLYKNTGPWADRLDRWLNPGVMLIKRGSQA